MIQIRFACQHTMPWADTAGGVPICLICGERRVASVQARPPQFRGTCQGPTATPAALAAIPLDVAPQGPLKGPSHA